MSLLKEMFRARMKLLREHTELPRSGWFIWTFFDPADHEPIGARIGDSILEYKGEQLAYLPYTGQSERQLESLTVWLEQWRRQLDYAHGRGNLLILTSALLSLAKRTFPTLEGLVIERGPRVG